MVRLLTLAIIGSFLCGCAITINDTWKVIQSREPEVDFPLLVSFLRQCGPESVVLRDGTEVVWRETHFYRIYEVMGNTIIVYPWDWDDKRHDIHLFFGGLDGTVDFRDTKAYQVEWGPVPAYNVPECVEWKPSVTGESLGFGQFVLGRKKQDILKDYREMIVDINASRNVNKWENALDLIDEKENFTWFQLGVNPTNFGLYSGDAIYTYISGSERLVYIRITGKEGPRLGFGFGWRNIERLTELRSGSFIWSESMVQSLPQKSTGWQKQPRKRW